MTTALTTKEKDQVARVNAAVSEYEGCENRSAAALVKVGAEYRKLKQLTGPKRFLEVAKAVHGFSKARVYQLLGLTTVQHVLDARAKTAEQVATHRAKVKLTPKQEADHKAYVEELKKEEAEAIAEDEEKDRIGEEHARQNEDAYLKAKSTTSPEDRQVAEEMVHAGYLRLSKTAHPDTGGSHEQMIRLEKIKQQLLTMIQGGF